MSTAQKSGGGISFLGLLAIVFITLKLCHVIEWSWWYVLMPLYAPLAGFCGALTISIIFAVFSGTRR